MQSDHTEFQADRPSGVAAAAAIAAAGVFLLVFVLQALPRLALAVADDSPWRLRQLTLWISLGCSLGAVLGAWRFRLVAYQRLLGWAFRGAAGAATLALLTAEWSVLVTTAFLAGVAGGWLWVVLIAGLRASAGTRGLGLIIGTGWAVAFALSGGLAMAGSSVRTSIILSALIAATGSLASPFLTPQEPSVSPLRQYRRSGVLRWSLIFGGAVLLAAMVGTVNGPSAAGVWPVVAALTGALAAGWLLDRVTPLAVATGTVAAFLLARFGGASGLPVVGPALLTAVASGALAVALCHHAARGGRVGQTSGLMITVAGAALVGVVAVRNLPSQGLGLALAAAAITAAGLIWRPRQ